ncbi:LmbE family N-acetylglucosaminyl deacetylase [Microbacterium sp. SORGH_AS 1204]|uniref:PIG-L family deacetylase n=1 Tax=Microbacterium sp. SORGH_AS_1204 TaxID=3041785 RepID=UPI00278E8FCC|nr:PIG-L family deacetylase [Microbacterium sp. SORGH_AS_1204]MDQ1137886.1 LmbE family N-acetylglucosaminyl deacetylase [Microbacterium sp. SORGH_AS_1204]
MTRTALRTRRSRRRRPAAAILAVITVAVVVVATAVGVFAFALLRPDPVATPAGPSPSPTPTSPPQTAGPTPAASATASSTPVPVPLPAAQACDRETVLGVWAHPDDDIIFANPTISDAIAAGDCVRTVFVTAGDAGRGNGYVEARELGILRAYNEMRGIDGLWDTTDLLLQTGVHARRLTPQGDPRLSVVFLRLPDGNITGEGFEATGYATLGRLLDGGVPTLAPVGGGPDVSRGQLLSSVAELAAGYSPSRVLTHIPRGSAFAPGDHPDHSVVGTVVRDTLSADAAIGPGIQYFVGYPSRDLPRNLDGAILDAKVDTYRIYTQQDEVIRCADRAACLGTRNFGEWLRRSYPKAEAELQMD